MFQNMMRQQTISGAQMNPDDIHRQATMQDGHDASTAAEDAANKINNKALNIDPLREKQMHINRLSKGQA